MALRETVEGALTVVGGFTTVVGSGWAVWKHFHPDVRVKALCDVVPYKSVPAPNGNITITSTGEYISYIRLQVFNTGTVVIHNVRIFVSQGYFPPDDDYKQSGPEGIVIASVPPAVGYQVDCWSPTAPQRVRVSVVHDHGVAKIVSYRLRKQSEVLRFVNARMVNPLLLLALLTAFALLLIEVIRLLRSTG